MKLKKPKVDLENVSTSIHRPTRPGLRGNVISSSTKTFKQNVPNQQELAFCLDKKGESQFVYPDSHGKYTFPEEQFRQNEISTPFTGAESQDTRELEDLLKNFNQRNNISQINPMLNSPKDLIVNQKNMTQYNTGGRGYASNIANIIKSTNVVSSPQIEKTEGYPGIGTSIGFNKNGGNSKPSTGGFPRDIFSINFKPKRVVP